jgi:hypothetical protein
MVFVIARPRRFRELVGVPINVRALWWTRAGAPSSSVTQEVNSRPEIRRMDRKRQNAPGKKTQAKNTGNCSRAINDGRIAKVGVFAGDAYRYATNFLYIQ